MKFFQVNYISIESNRRWFVAGCPDWWEASDLRSAIQLGGVGDDVAEVTEIEEVAKPSDGIYREYN